MICMVDMFRVTIGGSLTCFMSLHIVRRMVGHGMPGMSIVHAVIHRIRLLTAAWFIYMMLIMFGFSIRHRKLLLVTFIVIWSFSWQQYNIAYAPISKIAYLEDRLF